MLTTLLNGFLTGLLLQVAVGPVFFFILNLSIQRTLFDGYAAILAVTIVDYIYISLAILGVGTLLEKPKTRTVLGVIGSLLLLVFGISMIVSSQRATPADLSAAGISSNPAASFLSAFFLTLSSPLTIVFWTSLFAARATEKGYTRRELVLFGLAAGLATVAFLGVSVTALSIVKTSIPAIALKLLNALVGLLIAGYGIARTVRLVRETARDESA
jgi:threonine/homoserine/homoserine lactone efflux protein